MTPVCDNPWLHRIVPVWIALISASTTSAGTPPPNRYGPIKRMSNLDPKAYVQRGDINIGHFMTLSDYIGPYCSDKPRAGSTSLEFSETMAFAVKLVNENPNLLPNVTLGFITLSDCNNVNVVMSKSLAFLPRVAPEKAEDAACSGSSMYGGDADVMPYYDVIGVVSPPYSQPTVMMTQLLNTAGIPVVGSLSTSDGLSDKLVHPNFLRVVPADKYQVAAILKFIEDNDWSYVSVLYVIGSYGEKAFDTIKSNANGHGICIAAAHRIDDTTKYDDVVRNLLHYSRARVVILFVYAAQAKLLFRAVRNFNASGHFIWLGSDGLGSNYRASFSGYENDVAGMFSFVYYATLVQDYYDYLRKLNVSSSTNPWLRPAWESLAGCSLDNDTCDLGIDILQARNFGFYETTSNYIDAAMTFAHAAHDMLMRECPGAVGEEANACLKNQSFINYLKNATFIGYNGPIKFDSVGDVRGFYRIHQIVLDYTYISFVNRTSSIGPESRIRGIYDIERQAITYMNGPISWSHLRTEETVIPLASGVPPRTSPESVCSRPCVVGEYKIQKEPECCWECRECRDNERIVDNNTGCQQCEKYTWPDPTTNYATCIEIPLTYHAIFDTLPLIQTCLGVAALICGSLVVFCYVYFRDVRVIKAASRELSILQMVAIFVGYLTVILFQTTPTPGTCGVLYFSFCLSFAWLYAPLLVKVVRIYRIFESGTKNNRRPRFVSPQSQLILTAILIAIQLIICVYVYAVYRPTAKKTQPVPTEKFVELSCDMTVPGLASFLAYNLVLVCLCSVFAFKTRKLPDNFNESRFISMCVSTTLIIWLAFITTYFTASRDFVRVLVLSMALLLNHTVAIIFLYAPKIYAAVYLPPETFVTTRFNFGTMVTTHVLHRLANRVAPAPTSTSSEGPPKY